MHGHPGSAKSHRQLFLGYPFPGHPFPETSHPTGIPSQGHPFLETSHPTGIPSQGHPFPGAPTPVQPFGPRGAAPPQQRASSGLSPKMIQFPPYFLFHFPSQPRVSRGHPGPALGSGRRAASSAPHAPRDHSHPKFGFSSDCAKGRQVRQEMSSLLQHSQTGLTPVLACLRGANESLFY